MSRKASATSTTTKPAETIKSWSFSRLTVFEECAYRAKLQWIDKVPDLQPKTAADRGTAIHQEAEDYVTGKAAATHNLRHFISDLAALAVHFKAGRVVCEEEWAFDREWGVAEWAAGWLRLKCDAVCHLTPTHAIVIDYKTGKRFGNEVKHARQLQLYAVCSLLRYPELEQVTCELWYFDQDELASFTMHRRQLKKYLSLFDRNGRAVTEERTFKPSANIFSCKYCPYGPDKQGDCQYGVAAGEPARKTVPLVIDERLIATTSPMEDEVAEFLKRMGG